MSRNPGLPKTKLDELLSGHHQSQYVKKTYTISVITPMFGGGYEAGQVDTERIVRESSIKGHLRFWWRATRGAVFQDVQSLRQRETEIFGDTTLPSPVKLRVYPLRKSNVKPCHIPKYVLISRPASREYKRTLGYRFKLEVSFDQPDLVQEIQAALWGWINFGGLGARTRRGCGALYCPDFSPNEFVVQSNQIAKWFKDNVKKYQLILLSSEQSRHWPTLNRTIRVRTVEEFRTWKNWRDLIDIYSKFRRKANVRKNSKYPGRSFWPEADSIRSITKNFQLKHKNPFPSSKPEGMIAFPRAVLGMPIVFHFKEDKNLRRQDPEDTHLVPKDKQRLSSPIILKPLAYGINNSLALVAILNQPRIEGVELRYVCCDEKLKDISNVYTNVDYEGSPMKDANGTVHSSAVEAFLHSKEVKEFCKIKLTSPQS